MTQKYFIIDFDSTFIRLEGLEELAKIALEQNPKKNELIKQIEHITNLGMEGKIGFEESLSERLKLFAPQKSQIEKLIKILKKNISPSVTRNKEFFEKYAKNIYIISGGFKEWIVPITNNFKIPEKNILANEFIFDKNGNYTGYNTQNPLSKDGGKVRQIKKLGLKGQIYVIGDGYSDFQIKEKGHAKEFFAFTENINRKEITKLADHVIPNLDEFLYMFNLPRSQSYPKSKSKILLLENIHENAIKLFKDEEYQVEHVKTALLEDELIERIKNVKVLGIRSKTKITKKVLEKANELSVIGTFCIGTNQVDLKEATKKGIAVFNAPYENTRSVAELVIGEMILLNRNISDKSKNLHEGIWNKSAKFSHEIRGKALGIIGFGNIGTQISVLAENLGMKVYFYDIEDKLEIGNTTKCNTLKELLKISDIITLHIDGRDTNKDFITEKEFRLMKDGVIFMNLSRGFVVDIEALAKYLKNGKIRGAAIDVFPKEPKNNDEKFQSPIQKLPNVILTPHIGGSTEEAQSNIGNFVPKKVLSFLSTGDTSLSVNLPNIHLPCHKNTHRLIHIHQNIPGILKQINEILAKNNANIEGQYLKTNEDIGYVITDINKEYNEKVIDELKKIPGTIKLRTLF